MPSAAQQSAAGVDSLALDLLRANKDHRVFANQRFVVLRNLPSFQDSVAKDKGRLVSQQKYTPYSERDTYHDPDTQSSN